MPLNPEKFVNVYDDLTKVLDVDDGAREVPVNMTFVGEGYLTKDTGVSVFATLATGAIIRNTYVYKKKDGSQYIIAVSGDKVYRYFTPTNTWIAIGTEAAITGTVAVTQGTTAVVGTGTNFVTDLAIGQVVRIGTEVLVVASIADATHFATTSNVTQSTAGGLTLNKTTAITWSTTAKFGFLTYNNVLYIGNGVDSFTTFDGNGMTQYPALPKGNILEIFEDKLCVSGTVAEPLTIYYSTTGAPTTFPGANVLNPLGTDKVTGLVNYYGILVIFKKESIHKLTFVYDQVAAAFLPKLEKLNQNYGAVGYRAYCWVENDVWFFTGREVRALGFIDNNAAGVLGVNTSTLSEQLKERLKTLNPTAVENTVCFYFDNKFHLAVPVSNSFNDTIFVCHLLYKKVWTKLATRIKASLSDVAIKDNVVYSASGDVNGKLYLWSNSAYNDDGVAINAYVTFRELTQKDFSQSVVYRYLDMQFKNFSGTAKISIFKDDFDSRYSSSNTVSVGSVIEGEENALGEVPFGQLLFADSFGEGVSSSNFVPRRFSFLGKCQAISVRIENSGLNEYFTLAKFSLEGRKRNRRYYSPSKITSIS